MSEQPTIREEILDTEPMKKIFIQGIPKEATDEEFKTYLQEQAGEEVSELSVVRKDDSKPKLFAFATLQSSEKVDELILNKANLKFKDSELMVKRSLPRDCQGALTKTTKLFIANLPKEKVTEEELEKYFKARHPEKYGTIESIHLVKKKDESGNKTEELMGYGFINVTNEDMADKMAIQHAKFEYEGRQIEVKKNVPKEEQSRGGRGGFRGGRGGGRGGAQQQPYGGGYGGYGGYGYGGYQPPPYGGNQYYGGYGAGYGYGGGY